MYAPGQINGLCIGYLSLHGNMHLDRDVDMVEIRLLLHLIWQSGYIAHMNTSKQLGFYCIRNLWSTIFVYGASFHD